MTNLTISELKYKKEELEEDIKKLINEFINETKVENLKIDMNTVEVEVPDPDGNRFMIAKRTTSVSVEAIIKL